MVPRNSTPGGFAYIWQSKWVGIIAIKTERTQIHFLSDVLIAVASLDLKVPSISSYQHTYEAQIQTVDEKRGEPLYFLLASAPVWTPKGL